MSIFLTTTVSDGPAPLLPMVLIGTVLVVTFGFIAFERLHLDRRRDRVVLAYIYTFRALGLFPALGS